MKATNSSSPLSWQKNMLFIQASELKWVWMNNANWILLFSYRVWYFLHFVGNLISETDFVPCTLSDVIHVFHWMYTTRKSVVLKCRILLFYSKKLWFHKYNRNSFLSAFYNCVDNRKQGWPFRSFAESIRTLLPLNITMTPLIQQKPPSPTTHGYDTNAGCRPGFSPGCSAVTVRPIECLFVCTSTSSIINGHTTRKCVGF